MLEHVGEPPLQRIGVQLGRLDRVPARGDLEEDAVRQRRVRGIAARRAPSQPGLRVVLVLAAVLAAWRLAQLSIELPAPVVNSVVPLAVTVFVLWRVVGDPFAIQGTASQLQSEGVR